MSEQTKKQKPVHLSQEEILKKYPNEVGKVALDYRFYPGEDLYSDGAIEDELLKIVKERAAVEYPDIIEEKNSWPILYHLSALRGNIVDWLPIKPTDKVLEIGAGCGAITEKLSEKAGKVTCVDLSAKRSLINAWRNQDKDNIEIFVGNFSDIEPSLETDYDYACLIGVFEYGQSYIHTRTPYEDFLKIMRKHIKNNGRIVIAIENKLGLKYWAGCKEDHSGVFFDGLEGYPDGGSARTFTRKGLERIFRSCGVKEYSFYYPYPDYKFPATIFSDRRLPNQGELTDNMRNFDRDRMVLFHEKYVFDGLVQDGLFELFSNSFMAVLGPELEASYVKYSNDRAGEYELRTEILDTLDGRKVRKVPLSREAAGHIKNMNRYFKLLSKRYEGSGLSINRCALASDGSYAEFPFVRGVTLEELLDRCLETDDMEGFYRLFDKYLALISYGEEAEVADYDLIFANILVDGDRWTVIDYEWTVEKQVPSSEIAFRAVYCYVLEEEKRNKLDLDFLLAKLKISQEQARVYQEQEKKFQKQVTGKRKSMGELRAAMGTYAVDPKDLMERHLQKILDERIQVYYDRGNGFSENDSVYLPDVYVTEREIAADIPFDGNVRSLRIDPADQSCMVKIHELTLNGAAVPLNKKYLETNGKRVKDGCCVFSTQDPNILVRISAFVEQGSFPEGILTRGENILTVKMEVAPLSVVMAKDMEMAVKRLW